MKRTIAIAALAILLLTAFLNWRTEMQRIVTTVEIDRPLEEVFGFLTDLNNAPLWTVDLIEVRHAGLLRAGTDGIDVRKMGGKQVEMPWTVTRYEPPRAVQFTYGDPFPLTATFRLEPTPAGTRLTCDTNLRLRGFYRLLAPLIAWEARRVDAQQFQKAKQLLEGRVAEQTS